MNKNDYIKYIDVNDKYNINKEKIDINKDISMYKKYTKNNIFKKIETSNYKSKSQQEQLEILQAYVGVVLKKSDVNLDDMKLIKRIFDFSSCRRDLLDKSFVIIDFFKKCEIDLSAFLFYGVNTNTYKDTWGDMLLYTVNGSDSISFISEMWTYFRDNYFNPKNKNQNIVSFISFLDIYRNYGDLLKGVMKDYPDKIPDDIKDVLDNVFNVNNIINYSVVKKMFKVVSIKNLEHFREFQEIVDNSLIDLIIKTDDLNLKKIYIGNLFFCEMSLKTMIERYGNSEKLMLLQFNNRNNLYIVKLIENIMVMTSFIESILSIDNAEDFNSLLKKFRADNKYLFNVRKMLSKYDKMMVELYELESNYNLTNIQMVSEGGKANGQYIRKDINTSKGRVKTLDLSKCKYVLYAHVVGSGETIDELVNGKDDENKVFISLSPISHRNEVFYTKPKKKMILAYDFIPEGNYVLGSNVNVGSNHVIRQNSADFVSQIDYKQLGILETSMAFFNPYASRYFNAETVSLREGLKPCGIIVPKDRQLTEQEVYYSILYDLPIIYTQKQETSIRNPIDIDYDKEKCSSISYDNTTLSKISSEQIDTQLLKQSKSHKIGVLTDIHGMYEPTLAILEDMRRKGITEIYSLGDNIGFGPNPHEVMELLRKYNVKSVYGNHEIYAIDGMEALKDHLASISKSSIAGDKKRTQWTRAQLTEQDIEDIMKYQSKIVLERNGKKITLVHSRKEDIYELNGHFVKPEIDDDSIVIEGHDHFEKQQSDGIKLRAAGMGFDESDYGKARYLVIEEDGSFNTYSVNYNIANFKESVNESSMDDEIRSTIDRFVRR